MQHPKFNPEEVTKIIRGRRSQFPAQFKENEPVADSIIEEILENANWAPTHNYLIQMGARLTSLAQVFRSRDLLMLQEILPT